MADGDTLAEGRGGVPTLADEDHDDDDIGTLGATPEDEAASTAALRGTTTTPPSSPRPPSPPVSHQNITTTTGTAADHDRDTTTTPADGGDQYTTTTPGAAHGGQGITTATLGPPAGRGGVGTSTTTASADRTRDTDPGHGRGGESGGGGGGGGEGRGEGGAGGDSNHRASHAPRRGGEPHTLQHAGTQTPPVTRTTKGTSTNTTTREAATTPSPTPSPPRTPTRHYPRPHRAAYTPLPDRLSGPWSQRARATTAPPPPPHPPLPPHAPSPARSVLATLQQSLYTKILQRASTQDTTKILHNSLRLRDLQAGVGLTASYTTTNPHAPHLHNTLPLPHHHFRRPLLPASPPPRAYRYPVVRPEAVLSSSTLAAATQLHLRGSMGDLLSRQHPASHTYTYGGIRVRGSASLPDLYDPSPPPPTHGQPAPRLPRHAHSARDVMYGSGVRDRQWASSWRAAEDSDSGGSTDSLIDEAEFIASSASAPLDYLGPRVYEFGDERQQRRRHHRRQARRRTRSHQGAFPSWRGDSASTTGTPSTPVGGGSGRPYLPYRGDQLSPGQQVKVLAPGGGVAVARVLANQQGPRGMKGRHHEYEDAVTVVLLCEPNRLQGSVVTVPLEKVLLAWPRA